MKHLAPIRFTGNHRWLYYALLFICISSQALFTSTVEARQLDELYEVTVPQNHDQAWALREAMMKILLRLTANPETLNRPVIQQLLDNADQMVYSSQYLPAGAEDSVPLLSVRFNSEAIGRALSELNVPSWGASRPLTLIWVIVYDMDGRRIINKESEAHAAIINALEKQTDLYGLPMLYPLLDLEDTNKASTTVLWAGFADDIKSASQRYQPESILLLRLDNRAPDVWFGHWDVYLGEEHISWNAQASYADSLISLNMPRLATELGLRFGLNLVGGDEPLNPITIQVAGVTDYKSFGRLTKYLKNLHPVKNIQLIRAQDDDVELQINSHANRAEIHRLITLDSVLVSTDDSMGHYHLQTKP